MIAWAEPTPLLDGKSPEEWLIEHHAEDSPLALAARLSQLLGEDVSRNSIASKIYRLKKNDRLVKEKPQPATYLDQWKLNRTEPPTAEEILAFADKGAELQRRMRPIYTEATRRIVTDRPVYVVLMSDFHLGSPYTDYSAFASTTEFIKSREDMYLCVVGPDQELAFAWFRSAEAVLNQVIPPWMQLEVYRMWLDSILHRTLAVCADNHGDERLERFLGDIGLVWRDDVPYFRAQGFLKLCVGKTKYLIAMAHRYKGHSIYHDLQPALRMMRDIHPLADVYVTAHTHSPAYLRGVFYEEARESGKAMQHFLVTGTFKTGPDLYSMRNFGGQGILGLPTLKLWPDMYRIQVYQSPLDAVLE